MCIRDRSNPASTVLESWAHPSEPALGSCYVFSQPTIRIRQYPMICIYYDYEGIEKWANHTWMAHRQGTQAYQTFIDESRQKIEIHFMKVLAHSGDLYNEMADLLAKKAVGIA